MKNNKIMQIASRDPFLQRAIEYWLDSANELGYQPLFCEWLINQGYILKYSIKNTHFEQGKDVVAINTEGIPCGFQLKGGSINLKKWRAEVKPEIDSLIGCAIQHPDIDKNKPHISYLVTNGELEDNVRVEIMSLNEKEWKNSPLQVWTRGDLLSGFQTMAEGILPKDAITYKKLMDLMFAEGTGLPDIEKIYSFLCEIINLENPSIKKEARRRDIAAAILYATMIAGPYRKVENHGSVVRIMTLLLSLIFNLVDKYNLEDNYWIESYKIVWEDLQITAQALEKEVNENGFDNILNNPFEKELIPFRKYSAISIIYPLKLSQLISNNDEWKSMLDPVIAAKYKGAIVLWGEASMLPSLMIVLIFISLTTYGAKDSAINISKKLLLQIIQFNGRKSKEKVGLLPPYYGLDFAIKSNFDMLDEEYDSTHKLSSYFLKPLIEILVRSDQREFLSENWKEISHMRFEEFIPDNVNDYYNIKIEKGENRSTMPKKVKSWKELVEEATSIDEEKLPKTLRRFPAFLPFFLTVFPHRSNSESIGFIQKALVK